MEEREKSKSKNQVPQLPIIWMQLCLKEKIFIEGTINILKYQEILQEAWPTFR